MKSPRNNWSHAFLGLRSLAFTCCAPREMEGSVVLGCAVWGQEWDSMTSVGPFHSGSVSSAGPAAHRCLGRAELLSHPRPRIRVIATASRLLCSHSCLLFSCPWSSVLEKTAQWPWFLSEVPLITVSVEVCSISWICSITETWTNYLLRSSFLLPRAALYQLVS